MNPGVVRSERLLVPGPGQNDQSWAPAADRIVGSDAVTGVRESTQARDAVVVAANPDYALLLP